MRSELARQMKIEDQMVKIEDETNRRHNRNCQAKFKSDIPYTFLIIFRSKSGFSC